MDRIIETSDIALTRALFSVYRNTDRAAEFVLAEIKANATGGQQ